MGLLFSLFFALFLARTSSIRVYPEVTATYGDQSFSVGFLNTESLSLGDESFPSFVFGCGQDNDGLFGRSAGLVGLAKMWSDSWDPTTYFLKLTAISVSGKALGLPPSDYRVPTIIVSGTTISRLATPVYSALRVELVKIISSKFKMAAEAFSILDACFGGSFDEILSVGLHIELIIEFGGDTEP